MNDNRCPRCQATLSTHGDSLLCPSGCGEWFDNEILPPANLDDTWGKAGPCPRCSAQMGYLTLGKLTTQRCIAHGLFVTDPDRRAFFEMFREYQQQMRELRERRAAHDALVEQVMQEIADPRELARRIVDLERQVAALLERS